MRCSMPKLLQNSSSWVLPPRVLCHVRWPRVHPQEQDLGVKPECPKLSLGLGWFHHSPPPHHKLLPSFYHPPSLNGGRVAGDRLAIILASPEDTGPDTWHIPIPCQSCHRELVIHQGPVGTCQRLTMFLEGGSLLPKDIMPWTKCPHGERQETCPTVCGGGGCEPRAPSRMRAR